MTRMRRICISVPDELDRKILTLRKSDRFIRSSYAEIVRSVLEEALADDNQNKISDNTQAVK